MDRYVARFPEYFDHAESEIVAKGYFADLVVEVGTRSFRPVFYDPHRFLQECLDELAAGARCVREPNLILVETVDRRHLEAALDKLAQHDFLGFTVDGRPTP